jgi:uncharacterized protein (TIGR01777 family)
MPPARIVVAGGTGLLGRALSDSLADSGHDVIVLTRHASSVTIDAANAVTTHAGVRLAHWNPNGEAGSWVAFFDGAAAVVNLAGESIGSGRWTATRKRRIRDSRLDATRTLVAGLAACGNAPTVFVSQSAIGYYGARGDERLTEDEPPGGDFMARLCVEWEAAARQAAGHVARVVVMRTGLVLDREGGALPRMLLPFRLFLGGPLGSGSQYVSWIHIDDWVGLTTRIIDEAAVRGTINATAPNPVTNREFARAIGDVLGRPSWLPAPAIALRALLGELAQSLVTGQRVVPESALAFGFRFRYADVRPALEAVLRRR